VGRNPGEACNRLEKGLFDIGLLDLTLPDSSGAETFTRFQSLAPILPLVVLTGVENEAVGSQAIRSGVQEYLVKGSVDGKTVARAIRYAIERKKAEETLRQSEERFKAIAETTPVGIGVVGFSEAVFLYVNPAYLKVFGYSAAEILGKGTPEIYWTLRTTKDPCAAQRARFRCGIRGQAQTQGRNAVLGVVVGAAHNLWE